jgi:hypothetical protein
LLRIEEVVNVTLFTSTRFDFLHVRGALRGVAWWAVLSASACTYLVDPEAQEIKCVVTEAKPNPCASPFVCIAARCVTPPACDDVQNPCPSGLLCQAGECVDPMDCEPQPERCGDQTDNDCDGKIDEQPDDSISEVCGDGKDNDCDGSLDEGHDRDMDNNTWCGDTTGQGGMGDCDENDPTIFYGAPEICDGRDNNCDGAIDEAGPDKSLCAAGEECIGRCVAPSCAVQGSITCRSDEMCDSKSGTCVPRACDASECLPNEFCDTETGECTAAKKPNGEACGDHLECLSGSCIESASLALSAAAERVCGQTCCSDAECGTGQRCFSPGTGARSCLPLALVPAGGVPGATCSESSECGAGQSCGISHVVDQENDVDASAAVCIATVSNGLALGETCGQGEAPLCSAKVCIQSESTFSGPLYVCTSTCGDSSDCAALGDAVSTTQPSYCRFLPGPAPARDYLPICVLALSSSEVGPGATGTPCDSNGDCLDSACLGASTGAGVCASTCCNDTQCGPVGGVPTYCRPVGVGTHFETRCVF